MTSVNHEKRLFTSNNMLFLFVVHIRKYASEVIYNKYFMSTEGCQFQNQHVNQSYEFFLRNKQYVL